MSGKKDDRPMVCLEDVYVDYKNKDGTPKRVLNDIDLKIKEGELVTVVGSTGCGKSTLLRLILGSENPTKGIVQVAGSLVKGVDRTRGIVFQKYSLFPHLTVLENIVLGLECESFSLFQRLCLPLLYRKEIKQYGDMAREYLARIGLQATDADKFPHQLSGGMQQRVAIAQALIMKPSVLLMDEPFGALDDSTREKMQLFLLEQWKASGMTIFFVTHDLEEALFLGTRIIVLSKYYTTDDKASEGAKIVIDKEVPEAEPGTTDMKYSPDFTGLLHKIRTDGLDPNCKIHVKDFDLSHPDAFRTVLGSEWKK